MVCVPFGSVKNEPLVRPGDRLGHDFVAVGSWHTDTCAPCGSVKSGTLAQLYGGASRRTASWPVDVSTKTR